MPIEANLARLHEQIAHACRRANRPESDVALMAVSKLHPAEALLEAYAAGQRLFGENRVQEFQQKSASLTHLTDAEVHLIGPLQSNKTNRAAELFHSIDTVDSLKLATRLNSAAASLNKQLPIYIEVKLSPEESKHGLAPEDLPTLLNDIAPLTNLRPIGLMTVPPWTGPEDPEPARPYFRRLRELRDAQQRLHPTLTQLSIGMSNDFAVAIEEGSTCIRIGTAIFGKREPQPQP
ncbi:MAG TPA: YggS family pyridoxal phosphate-dependent enzyme [Granulicella sp.]|nr:YggS family pyridoxal phosphate-dependent enzyme [Granulicella sp.]